MAGLADFKQDRIESGLSFDANSPQAQMAQRRGELVDQGEVAAGQADIAARTRSEATFNQIRQAGLAGLAQQFKRSQRAIAFDTARRGTLGGSRTIERGAQAQGRVQQGVGNVLNQAQGAANQQLNQDRAGIFGFQQQLAGRDPFASISAQGELNNLQQQGQSALGQFDLSQQQDAIRSGAARNRAQNIFGTLGAIGTGAAGVIRNNANQTFLNNLQTLGG